MSSCVRYDWDDEDDYKDRLDSQSKKEKPATEASILDKVFDILNQKCEYDDYEELDLDELIFLKDFYGGLVGDAKRLILNYKKSIN